MPFVAAALYPIIATKLAIYCCPELGFSFVYVFSTNGIIFRWFTMNDKEEWIIYALDAMVFALVSYANKLPCELTR